MFKSLWLTWKFEKFKREFAKEINGLQEQNYPSQSWDWNSAFLLLNLAHDTYKKNNSTFLGWLKSILGFDSNRNFFHNILKSTKNHLKDLRLKSQNTLLETQPIKREVNLKNEQPELYNFLKALKETLNCKIIDNDLSYLLPLIPDNIYIPGKTLLPDEKIEFWHTHLPHLLFETFKENILNNDNQLHQVEEFLFKDGGKTKLTALFCNINNFNFIRDINDKYYAQQHCYFSEETFKSTWHVSQNKNAYPKWSSFIENRFFSNNPDDFIFQTKSKFDSATNQELKEIWTINNLITYFRSIPSTDLSVNLKLELLQKTIRALNHEIQTRNNNIRLHFLTRPNETLDSSDLLPTLEFPAGFRQSFNLKI